MATTNHRFNGVIIDYLGGKERTKEILEKHTQPWRISRGGLKSTIRLIESRELHGKLSVKEAADKLDCCNNTVYKAQNNKENSHVPQNELCLPCRPTGIFLY